LRRIIEVCVFDNLKHIYEYTINYYIEMNIQEVLKKVNPFFLFLLILVMLPNIVFVNLDEGISFFLLARKFFFFVYKLSLVLLPLSFLRPKVYFLLFLPLLPFALIDLYVLNITTTQSTSMHYFSFFNTNSNEAIELLKGNIGYTFLAILYVVLFVYALSKLSFSFVFRKKIKFYIGIVSLSVVSILFLRELKVSYAFSKSDVLNRATGFFMSKLGRTFPLGVLTKVRTVYDGYKQISNANVSNVDFSYNPSLVNIDDRTIVLVIGEAARRENFQIYGYERENNPKLSKENNLIPFTEFTTCANFTLTSVTQMLSSVGPANYDEAYNELGLIAAFKESGYKTYWMTNQEYTPGSIYNLYSKSADVFKNLFTTFGNTNNDSVCIPVLDDILNDQNNKKFIIIHTIGSHYRYNHRYPKNFSKYKPDLDGFVSIANYNEEHKKEYVNSYDNSILFTDYFLTEIISRLKNREEESIMMYLSDHGENLYDDERGLFLHGTSNPSKYELEIPMFLWHSNNFDKTVVNRLHQVKDEKLSSEIVFHTLSNLGGFVTNLHDYKYDLLTDSLVVGRRTVLKGDGSVMKVD